MTKFYQYRWAGRNMVIKTTQKHWIKNNCRIKRNDSEQDGKKKIEIQRKTTD